ncbi:hypothetical protein SSX86_017464 [Deinandra increscens subsp. villosa]|uniref:F-box domain-containing protein n=1 Tax=Deinandra increscens subsp. villosa TaxID=3103831 RepID=A0AAP0D2I1_9ASTR
MFPENVIFEVLSRLPAKSITRCKCVCKEWLDIVSDPHFVRHHLSSKTRVALMIHESTDKGVRNLNAGALKWVEMERKYPQLDKFKKWRKERGESLTVHPVRSLDFTNRGEVGGVYQIGSVNGLVSYWAYRNFIYILNPVLEEYMTLPLPPVRVVVYDYYNVKTLGYGFGVSLTTGEYKVYTIGDTGGQWRRIIISTPNNLDFRGGQPGVYVNSHLYWLGDHGQIYGFDLTTEEMSELLFPNSPPPPAELGDKERMLGVLKGDLSFFFCSSSSSGGGGFEVWVMKEEEESNKWYKEIVIQEKDITTLLPKVWTPVCLIDGLNGTNSLLMLCDAGHENLVAYCLTTNKVLSRTPISWDIGVSSIMAFRPSFVKLDNFKSLGRESSCQGKKRKSSDR